MIFGVVGQFSGDVLAIAAWLALGAAALLLDRGRV